MNNLINFVFILIICSDLVNAMENLDDNKKQNNNKFNNINLDFNNLNEDLFLELFGSSVVSISIDKISRLEKVLSMSPNLKELDLSETKSINSKDIAVLLSYHNITSLNLSCHTLNFDCAKEIQKLKWLKSLNLNKCVVDDINIINSFRNMTNLSKLNVDGVVFKNK